MQKYNKVQRDFLKYLTRFNQLSKKLKERDIEYVFSIYNVKRKNFTNMKNTLALLASFRRLEWRLIDDVDFIKFLSQPNIDPNRMRIAMTLYKHRVMDNKKIKKIMKIKNKNEFDIIALKIGQERIKNELYKF